MNAIPNEIVSEISNARWTSRARGTRTDEPTAGSLPDPFSVEA
jgi:hypothetical protein